MIIGNKQKIIIIGYSPMYTFIDYNVKKSNERLRFIEWNAHSPFKAFAMRHQYIY